MIHNKHGFTLLEILVVMVIIGIATTVIVFSVGGFYLSNKRADVVTHEMATLIELARNQAIFSLNTLGLEINSNSYSFVQLDDNKDRGLTWQPLSKRDSFWSERTIPSNIIVQVQSKNNFTTLIPTNSVSPQIMIFPNGEITPFTITVHSQGSSELYTIEGNSAGEIKVSK